jgi:hypothetical protein
MEVKQAVPANRSASPRGNSTPLLVAINREVLTEASRIFGYRETIRMATHNFSAWIGELADCA